ncbi:MAG: hypothetical protein AB7K24_26920 [Gemmataceae bacterium]
METAQIVLAVISAVAMLVWLTGLQFLALSARKGRPDPHDDLRNTGFQQGRSLAGRTEIDGQPSALSAKAASILVKGDLFSLGPIKIAEKTDEHIVFERLESGSQAAGSFRRGVFHFESISQGRCRVEWMIELTNMPWLLRLGALFQVLGILAIAGGGWAIYTFVVSSPNPGMRWQTFQMVQVVHFLWPPFLFGGLYRRGISMAAGQFEAFANNLPYHE